MAKRVHVAGIFVSCMSSVPRVFVRPPNSHAALTIHTKLFTFTRVKRVHARVHTHACVKFKVSGTVAIISQKVKIITRYVRTCYSYTYICIQICIKCMLTLKVAKHLCMHTTLLCTIFQNSSYVLMRMYVHTYVATFGQIMNLLHDGLQ